MKNILRKIITISIACGIVVGCALIGFAQTADERLAQAFAAYNKGDFDGALARVTEALKIQPDNTDAYYLRGLINFYQKNYEAAIADETRAIELRPDIAEIYYQRGFFNYKYRSQDLKPIIADLDRAIRLKPDYAEAYLLRGMVNTDLGLINDDLAAWKAAESDYSAAIKNGVNTQNVYQRRGYANLLLKNYAQSIADSRKALEFPENDDTYHIKQNLDEALKQQAQAAAPAAENSQTLSNRAQRESQSKDYDQAISDASAAIELDPKNYFAYTVRAFCFVSKGRYEEAVADETKVLEIKPDYVDAYFNRAIANQYLNRAAATIDDYQEVIDLAPANPLAKTAQDSLGAFVKSLDTDLLVSLINPRLDRLNQENHIFVANAAKQAGIANSNPGDAAACQSLNELMPSFREYKLALHRTFFILSLNSDSLSNLASITANIQNKEQEMEHDEKTINDQKIRFKCEP